MNCALCQQPILPVRQSDGTYQRQWANGPHGPQHWPGCPEVPAMPVNQTDEE